MCSVTYVGAAPTEECTCDSVLWHAVLQHMAHVCDDDAPCRDSSTGRCKWLYDEERFSPMTVHVDKKRPQYKRLPPSAGGRFAYKMVRMSNGVSVRKLITDTNVVPHNPRLLLAPVGFKYQFDAHEDKQIVRAVVARHSHRDAWHSNTEISSNPTSNIKYLYLYFCKGEDRVICTPQARPSATPKPRAALNRPRPRRPCADSVDDGSSEDTSNNECKKHLNGQHHSPESSVWKLLGLAMNRQSHRCELLLLAYPGKEYVRFDADAAADEVEASAEAQVIRTPRLPPSGCKPRLTCAPSLGPGRPESHAGLL